MSDLIVCSDESRELDMAIEALVNARRVTNEKYPRYCIGWMSRGSVPHGSASPLGVPSAQCCKYSKAVYPVAVLTSQSDGGSVWAPAMPDVEAEEAAEAYQR